MQCKIYLCVVQIFDQDGKLLQTIGGIGTAKGLFRLI